MTEAEWLASADPAAMGAAVRKRKRAGARVLRLYLAAFWHWQADWQKTPGGREQVRRYAADVEAWADSGVEPTAARASAFVGYRRQAGSAFASTVGAPAGWGGENGPAATAHAVVLLREIFGNPFTVGRKRKGAPNRGWMFDKAWRTGTAVALAAQMYESRDFSAMPILADALQDAGCDNDDVLEHCRGAGALHVRGCWVLDLVLGKGLPIAPKV